MPRCPYRPGLSSSCVGRVRRGNLKGGPVPGRFGAGLVDAADVPEQEGKRALNLFCCDRRTPSEGRVASSRAIRSTDSLSLVDGGRERRGTEPREGAIPFLNNQA